MAILHVILKVGTMNKENINPHENSVWYFINEKKNKWALSALRNVFRKTYF